MQENVKRIKSYQLDRPNFSMLFCSRENRQENVLDSTGSHGFEQNLNLKILARRKVFSIKYAGSLPNKDGTDHATKRWE